MCGCFKRRILFTFISAQIITHNFTVLYDFQSPLEFCVNSYPLLRRLKNAGRENDGPSKSQGVIMQHMKLQDMKMQNLKCCTENRRRMKQYTAAYLLRSYQLLVPNAVIQPTGCQSLINLCYVIRCSMMRWLYTLEPAVFLLYGKISYTAISCHTFSCTAFSGLLPLCSLCFLLRRAYNPV